MTNETKEIIRRSPFRAFQTMVKGGINYVEYISGTRSATTDEVIHTLQIMYEILYANIKYQLFESCSKLESDIQRVIDRNPDVRIKKANEKFNNEFKHRLMNLSI